MLVCISLLLLILLLFSLPLGVCWRQSFYEKTSFLSVSVSIHDRSHVHIFFYEILYRIFHPHLCLPCLCVPSMWQYNAPAGNLFSSILISWPNHVHLFLILSTSILNHSVSSLVCVCVCVYILYMYIYMEFMLVCIGWLVPQWLYVDGSLMPVRFERTGQTELSY